MAPFGDNVEQWVEMGAGKVGIEMASMEEKLEMGGGEGRKEMLSLEGMTLLNEGGKGMKEMASKDEKLEMAHDSGKDRPAIAAWEEKLEPACVGRERGGVAGLKRVMSEASFIWGQGLASNGDGSYNYNNTKTYGLMNNNGSTNEPRDEEVWEEEGAMAPVEQEEVAQPLDVKKMVAQQPHVQQLEVMVACECCGISEECTLGYIERVKGLYSGRWICGLCAAAVQEERHRLGRGSPMEEAVRAHMNLCSQFSAKKVAGPPPGVGVAHAVCHLLRRHLSDPAGPPPPPSPPSSGTNCRALSRTSSCRPFFSNRS